MGVLSSAGAADTPRVEWQAQPSGVTARLRGISAVSARVAWASGADGTVLRTIDGGVTWEPRPVPGAEKLDFRDVDAMSEQIAYVAQHRTGETSRIYKTSDGGARWDLQFANTDPKVFLDAMVFRDADHGVAFSDSVDGRFVILTTADGGRAWNRVPADRLPAALPGEGAFAASGTNVAVHGSAAVWIGTTAGRVLRSADGGRSWAISTTPTPDERVGRHLLDCLSRRPAWRRRRRRLQQGERGGRQCRGHERRRRDLDARQRPRACPAFDRWSRGCPEWRGR